MWLDVKQYWKSKAVLDILVPIRYNSFFQKVLSNCRSDIFHRKSVDRQCHCDGWGEKLFYPSHEVSMANCPLLCPMDGYDVGGILPLKYEVLPG